ncbi:MAG TPA: WG repeat-containing protein [Candidatus Absconditabacterales bacterium]|nr:WG repeat-containing protein [Candidatus Absconditabacterales bacterium]HOQ79018.1 WG repeat-containing protein [Candidatus Absconditabacterales bacterium]HPK27645.1 WG repeat-containing protein [Candidatus Absconditabacterales bacterium]
MEKSTIQERHDQLDQEILSFAKNENYALMKQKVDLQKKLSQILEKGKQEEMVFDEKNLLDDQLYVKAKEVGDQKLLDKFHNRSLTRKEYVKTCKDLDIDLGVDYYYDSLVRFDKVGMFNEYGLADVKIGNKYGLINKEGEEITEIKYNMIFNFNKYGLTVVQIGNKYGVINTEGKEICERMYDDIFDFDEYGLAKVKLGDNYGLINTEGKEIIKCDDCTYIGEFDKCGLVEVEIDGERCYVNREGIIFRNFIDSFLYIYFDI